ncbi:DNA dC-_dU-editing enzyme APOBEC-3F, partial [Pichia kudriavzevii]
TIEANQDLKKEIITGYKKDTNYALIFRTLREKTKVPVEIKNHIKHFCYQDEVRYYKTLESQDFFRVVIPNYKKLPYRIFKNAHDAKDACHFDSIKASPFEIAYEYEPSMIRKVNSWDLEDNKYSPNAEEFVRRVKLILQHTG